tara:strand:- start:598 stop:870 length:273 start_codon:yes stop_codon:yes gene_type:complete
MSSQQELRPWRDRILLQADWKRTRWDLWERRTMTTYRRVIRRARYRYGWQVRRGLRDVWAEPTGELIAAGEEDTAQKARAAADRHGVTLD